ncbi:hypothetical protein [Streptomyces sp. NPDC085479]|uniref:hypothetical protein n=1 Tax=Streptomyces sp. NPDC085479 TaxID=3365726 RepID=UPI0037D726C9
MEELLARPQDRQSPPALAAPDLGRDGADAVVLTEVRSSMAESSAFLREHEASGTGPLALEQLHEDVRMLADDYLRRPLPAVFQDVLRLRRDVLRMLDQRQRHSDLMELYQVAGHLSAMLSYSCFDLGHPDAATTHARAAWACAEQCDSGQLQAYIRWAQSNIAYWHGRYPDAVALAQSGQRLAKAGTSLLRLTSQEARAHAAMSGAAEVERTLSLAQTCDMDALDDPAGVFSFVPGKFLYYSSEALLQVGGEGSARRAVAAAEESLAYFRVHADRSCPEFLAAARLDAASAHLALRDVDGAMVSLDEVLRIPAKHRTTPVRKRMDSIVRLLAGAGDKRAAAVAAELRQIGERTVSGGV